LPTIFKIPQMAGVDAYRVNIVGLSNKIHQFRYQIGDAFFERYGQDLVSSGAFDVEVALNKHETFLEATFSIKGKAQLVCDRSLDTFEHPVELTKFVVFKYGEETREVSDEIMLIHRDTASLELGQFIYEFIALAIPMKKLHPRYHQENEPETGGIVYSSKSEEDKKDDEIDPRWEKLKKLK
jgi:uncharacterized protein